MAGQQQLPPPPTRPVLTTSPFHLHQPFYDTHHGLPVASPATTAAAASAQTYHEPDFASLVYRVPQLSDQQQHHHHHQHQAAAFLAGSAPGYVHPAIRYQQPQSQQPSTPLQPQPPQSQQRQLPIQTRQQIRLVRASAAATNSKMAAGAPASGGGMTDDEYAEYQKLSNEYEPEVKGPLVGPRQDSSAIAIEYATADARYQAKTADLAQKYSYYRTVRGDGRCGWRAIAYGYFETLIHLGDGHKFLEEETRLRSLINTCVAAGFEEMMIEDFADVTFDLLRKVANGMHDGTAEGILHEAFNDDMMQNYIITHFRTLTAAWMKTHAQEYVPWLLNNQTVDEYISASINAMASELENLSMSVLKDVLLSPAGISLEVLYLDRSEGDQANLHRFSPEMVGYDIGTIRLLYRPGHYDIVYMPQDLPPAIPPAPQPSVVPAYLCHGSQPYQDPVFELGYSDFMTAIPGMSYANPHQSWLSSTSYGGPDFFAAPIQQFKQPVSNAVASAPQPQPIQPTPVYAPVAPPHVVPPPTQLSEELAIRTVPQSTVSSHPSFSIPADGPFRQSLWQLETGHSTHMMPLQTSQFKNSCYNTAHFLNPEFQPEEWHPEDEYVTTNPRNSNRHRNGSG